MLMVSRRDRSLRHPIDPVGALAERDVVFCWPSECDHD
jgi:hypothetical protein